MRRNRDRILAKSVMALSFPCLRVCLGAQLPCPVLPTRTQSVRHRATARRASSSCRQMGYRLHRHVRPADRSHDAILVHRWRQTRGAPCAYRHTVHWDCLNSYSVLGSLVGYSGAELARVRNHRVRSLANSVMALSVPCLRVCLGAKLPCPVLPTRTQSVRHRATARRASSSCRQMGYRLHRHVRPADRSHDAILVHRWRQTRGAPCAYRHTVHWDCLNSYSVLGSLVGYSGAELARVRNHRVRSLANSVMASWIFCLSIPRQRVRPRATGSCHLFPRRTPPVHHCR